VVGSEPYHFCSKLAGLDHKNTGFNIAGMDSRQAHIGN
jgi:hypothetical protein